MDPLFPPLPEDLSSLSDEDLDSLIEEHKKAVDGFDLDTKNRAASEYRRHLDGSRETSHQFLCRISNQDPGMRNIVKRLAVGSLLDEA